MSKNETLILASGRSLWNFSYNNRHVQKLIWNGIDIDIFLDNLFKTTYTQIEERIAGILANLTQLESENCKEISDHDRFSDILKWIHLSYKNNKFNVCKHLLMMLANVCDQEKKWYKESEAFEYLMDSQVLDISEQATRIFSNIIGYTKEWLTEGYKPKIGLNKY